MCCILAGLMAGAIKPLVCLAKMSSFQMSSGMRSSTSGIMGMLMCLSLSLHGVKPVHVFTVSFLQAEEGAVGPVAQHTLPACLHPEGQPGGTDLPLGLPSTCAASCPVQDSLLGMAAVAQACALAPRSCPAVCRLCRLASRLQLVSCMATRRSCCLALPASSCQCQCLAQAACLQLLAGAAAPGQ